MITFFTKIRKFSKIPIWILSIVLAILFWINSKMVNVYNYNINIPIHYNKIPKNLIFKNNPPKNFPITIQETGKKLFDLIFDESLDSAYINIHKTWEKGTNFIVIDKKDIKNFDENIYHYLNKNSFKIYIDSISTKTVPINSNIKLNIEPNLIQIGKLKILNDKIKIVGAKSILDKITILNVKKNTIPISKIGKLELSLKIDNTFGINLVNDTVKVKIEIQRKKNKVIDDIPIKIINSEKLKDSIFLKNKFISVVVVGGENILNGLSSRDFNVFVDYSTIDLLTTNEIKPKITSFKELESIRSYPNKIKIIRK